jgi:uncharacterized membrane protein YuzA (DUF378 family)
MSKVKAIGLTLLFGLLSVITVTVGALVGLLLTVLTPILLIFTGLWGIWFISTDFDKKSSKQDD